MITQFLDLSNTDLKEDNIELRLERLSPADPSRGYVPAYFFYIIDTKTGSKAGRCDLRLGHNERLFFGGNIGYTVFPEFRGDHFAKKACRVLFKIAAEHDMDHVIITCSPNNEASRHTLESLQGEFLGIHPLPDWHDMYKAGHRQTCIFKYKI